MLSVVAPGRSLRTTLPVFQRRVPVLLLRLGLPGAWIQARAYDLGQVHIARAGAQTLDRTVLGTMTDATYQIRAEAEAAGTFDRLDLDRVEDGLAQVPLGALRSEGSTHGFPADAVADSQERDDPVLRGPRSMVLVPGEVLVPGDEPVPPRSGPILQENPVLCST